MNSLRNSERGFVVVTHYQRLLNHIVPDVVHVLSDGKILVSGDRNLALRLEREGYETIRSEATGIVAEPGFSSENFLASLGGVEGDVAVTSQGQGSSAASASPASTTNPWQDTALPGQGLAWIDSVREKAVVQLRDHGLTHAA